MSKTFGQLKAGDEVYIIIGSNVDIVKVTNVEPSQMSKGYVCVVINDCEFTIRSLRTHFYDAWVGDVYCDIDEAMRKMQEICAKALHDYRCASVSLNLLETQKERKEK